MMKSIVKVRRIFRWPNNTLHINFQRKYNQIYSPRYNKNIDSTVLLDGYHSQTHRLIRNKDLREKYVLLLQRLPEINTQQLSALTTNLDNLLDIATGFPDPTTITLIFDIWKIISNGSTQLDNTMKDKLIHMIINTRNYHLYETHILPLYKQNKLKKTWADDLVTTYGLHYEDGEIRINRLAIISYLKGDINVLQKRKFLAILIHAGVLNASNIEERYFFLGLFVDLSRFIEDGNFLFLGKQYDVYSRVLRLMGTPYKVPFLQHATRLSDFFENGYQATRLNDDQGFQNLITSIMSTLNSASPNTALNFWKYKLDICEDRGVRYRDLLDISDLTLAMSALCILRLHKEALDMYSSYLDLHHEDQIEILLRISEETKNWKLLQSQFEDMYGRGNLPYIEHYVVVMRALSSIGARDQIDLLFTQLKKRNLIPNALIFSALINSRLHEADIQGAKKCFEHYLEYVAQGLLPSGKSPQLYALVFNIHFKSSDLDLAMKFLRETFDQQVSLNKNLADHKEGNISLLNTSTLGKLVELAAKNYGLLEIQEIQEIAQGLGLVSAKFYRSLAKAYISLDQYELADRAVYNAHLESEVPFTNADIYAVQLRNYRFWSASLPKSDQKTHLQSKQTFITELIQIKRNEVVSAYTGSLIYTEVVQYYLNRGKMEEALGMLQLAKLREVLSEVHFIPILTYLSNKADYELFTEILATYRRMAKERVEISTRTYIPLMKALIFLDRQGQNGGSNSFKLLKSIFEMNGLSLTSAEPESIILSDLMFENSVDLCEIVSTYVESTSDELNNQLLVNFFNQMKLILGQRLSNKFKFSVYKEMSKVYKDQKNTELALKLIGTGLSDLNRIIDKYEREYHLPGEVIIPTTLMKNYRRLVNLKLEVLGIFSTREDYLDLLKGAFSVRLSGMQYNKIFQALFKKLDLESLHLMMGICETHLISGNWVDVKLMRIQQQLYKLAILHAANIYGDQEILTKYKHLNAYYNTSNLTTLRKEIRGRPFDTLSKLFSQYRSTLQAYSWTPDRIVEEIPEFFNPERRTNTRNKITPSNCHQLWLAINTYADGDITKAFNLMDLYPETIEFLMYNNVARIRKSFFRSEIDKLVAPRFNLRESFGERKDRTLEAMNMTRAE